MKKIMTLVLAICMCAMVFTGCGGSGKGQQNPAAQAKAAVVQQEVKTNVSDGYVIYVKDAETEEPVAGAKVQFCSDTQCMMGVTDENGAAVFDQPAGDYEAHVLKAAGYQKTEEAVSLTKDERTAVFMLVKADGEVKK